MMAFKWRREREIGVLLMLAVSIGAFWSRSVPLCMALLLTMPLGTTFFAAFHDPEERIERENMLLRAATCVPYMMLLPPLPTVLRIPMIVWLVGCAAVLWIPQTWLNELRTAFYWATVSLVTVMLLICMADGYYQGDIFSGLAADLVKWMTPEGSRASVLYQAYRTGLAGLDSRRKAALTLLSLSTNGNWLPWLTEDVLQQLEWSFQRTLELLLPTQLPDLLVKGIMLLSLGMLLFRRRLEDEKTAPPLEKWHMPTALGRSMGVLLLLSVVQYMTSDLTVMMSAQMLGCCAFWAFAVQGLAVMRFVMQKEEMGQKKQLLMLLLTLLILPIVALATGMLDQLKDIRQLRPEMWDDGDDRDDDDF